MGLRRRVALGVAAVVVGVGVGAAPVAPPSAVALVPNSAAALAVNVPGSVLAAAAPTGRSGAGLAAFQAFDFGLLDPSFALVSGSLTPTPVDPGTTLSPGELAEWDRIVEDLRQPQATKAAKLVKVLGGVGAAVSVYELGAAIGHGVMLVGGYDPDGAVCGAADGAGQQVLAALTGADCTAWNEMAEEYEANADVTPIYSGGTSCRPDGVCATLTKEVAYYSTSPWGSSYISQWHGTRGWCVATNAPSGHSMAIRFTRTNGTAGSAGTHLWATRPAWTQPFGCTTNRWAYVMTTSTSGPWPPMPMEIVSWSLGAEGNVVVPEELIPDEERVLVCRITGTDGLVYNAASQTFTEGSGTLPPIVCPTLPPGVGIASFKIIEQGGGMSHTLLNESATGAYTDWWTAFPECRNGSCLLDLRQSGDSCFADGVDCDGWFTDPDRDTIYSCHYGTHAVALNECYLYAESFDPGSRASGHGWGDPGTGAPVEEQTSPTDLDRLTKDLLKRALDFEVGDTSTEEFIPEELSQTEMWDFARIAAGRCLQFSTLEKCKEGLPIFMPGDDVWEAAKHDYDAIEMFPEWVQLNRLIPPIDTTWYSALCSGSSELHCDDYPYRSTEQGGPAAPGHPQASIRLVNSQHNLREGGYLVSFYNSCSIGNGDPFLVVPIMTLPEEPAELQAPTLMVCDD